MKTRIQTTALLVGAALASSFTLATSSHAANAPSATSAPVAAAPVHLPPGINWQQGDVDAAFALAKSTRKPLFLYWGAVWCPPCNQVKATIFSQQAFKDRAALFVPVYVDGDSASAQKLGEKFKVRGYPTMILFSPDGTEVSRIPGEVDFDRYMQALALAMNATHPVRQTVAAGLANGAKLSDGEWRMLADYSWDQQADLPIAQDKVAVTLQTLSKHAQANHASDEALRLELEAVASAALSQPAQTGTLDKTAALATTQAVLADAKLARANFDVVVNYGPTIVAYLTQPATPQRTQLASQWDAALHTLSADTSISTTDRLSAVDGRVELAKLDVPKGTPLPKSLVDTVREQAALADKSTTNAFERQSVIDAAADTLADAGLLDDSDRLLTAELKRSPAPYYFMSGLARNAKARGDTAGALKWYQAAYDASEGPATRLRWGAKYLAGVIDLAPNDDARVEQIATGVISEISQTHDAFYGANRAALDRVTTGLAKWNAHGAHRAAIDKVASELGGVCGKLQANDPQHATCEGLLRSVAVKPVA
ncbi:thioredoxin family protein [Pararobbsia alpina]|uniref:thioredoxin family protein n=1 Tax=Pararobbsia alpina TaxID=621374 RepID=UPI0039A49DD7